MKTLKLTPLNLLIKLSCILLVFLLVGCSSGGKCGDNKVPLNVDFQIDYVGMIPVVNGNATTSKFYVHNLGSTPLSKITYTLAESIPSAESGSDVVDNHGFKLHVTSLNNCASLESNASCAIQFTTPNMSLSNQNNSLLIVEVTDSNGFKHVFHQVLNYMYYSASVLNGVNFSGAANVVTSLGNKRYFTAYLVGGNSVPGVIYKNVNLQFDNPSILSINQGFINGQDIAPGEVVPIEFNAKPNSNAVTPINITPIFDTEVVSISSKINLAALPTSGSGQGLFVNTSTEVNSVLSVKLGSIPLLKSGSNVTIYVSSFAHIGTMNITPDNSNIRISNDTCTSGIESNGSCRFDLTATSDAVGTTLINFSLPQTSDEVFEQEVNFGPDVLPPDTVQVLSNNPVSSVGLLPNQQSGEISFVFSNLGNSALNNLVFNPVVGPGVEMRIISNGCGDTLAPGSQCVVKIVIVATASSGSGAVYLELNGTSDEGRPVTAKSSVINYAITASGGAIYFTSPNGATATMVVTGNERDSMRQDFTIYNSGTTARAINSVTLAGNSVPTGMQIVGNDCGSSLAGSQSCIISVQYGPMLLESNVNGITNLVVNYGESVTIQGIINYTGLGLDSSLQITNVVTSGFEDGNGLESSPYKALGCKNSIPQITITYKNISLNYIAQNLSLNTTGLSPYLKVNTGLTTCGYGSNVHDLAVGDSCDLVLDVNKQQMDNASEYTLNMIYPKATWNTEQGFVSQDNFLYNGSNEIFANYTQPSIVSVLDPLNSYNSVRTLTQTLVNGAGCGSITNTISSLRDFGATVKPTVNEGDCSVGDDDVVTCINSTSSAINTINYVLPSDLPLPVSFFFEFNATGNSQVWFNPKILVFTLTQPPL